MKKKWKVAVIILVIVTIMAPIIIGWGVSQDILNEWTNDNDWISFWGSYIGTIIGSGVTLFVLWSTLQDNKCAREREEKICYYNNLIEIIATFASDAGDYLALITRLMNKRDDDTRSLCIQAGNRAAKSCNILEAQLYIKIDVKNIAKIIEHTKLVSSELDGIGDDVGKILKQNFRSQQEINNLRKRTDMVTNKINELTQMFPKIIKEELEK